VVYSAGESPPGGGQGDEFVNFNVVDEDGPEPEGGLSLVVNLPQAQSPLIDLELASQKLGPKVLAALDAKFNGSLTLVRYPDANDLLF
jgi:hypothetical protein